MVSQNHIDIVIDILSPDTQEMAKWYNHYQNLRDPSHVASPSLHELKEWYTECGLTITSCEVEESTQYMADWMNLPSMKAENKENIRNAACSDIAGRSVTGLRPFWEMDKIKVREQVAIVVGQK